MPAASFYPKIQRFDTSMFVYSWGATTFDALYVLQSLLRTPTDDRSGNGDSNLGRFSDARMDALVDRIKVEPDMKKRDAFIRDALLISAEQVPLLPFYQPVIPWAMRRNVDGPMAPNNLPYFFRFRVS